MLSPPTIPRLVPLLVWLLGVSATVAGPAEGSSSAASAAREHIAALALAVTAFERDMGRFPSTAEGLRSLVERPVGPAAAQWQGPYLEPPEVPVDPWGNAYGYLVRPEDAERPFSLYSCGPDRASASAGNDADDVALWRVPAATADAATPAALGALTRRLLHGPLAIIAALTVAVALLRRHAGRVARQAQPHVDGYVRRHRRPRRPAATGMQPQGPRNLKA